MNPRPLIVLGCAALVLHAAVGAAGLTDASSPLYTAVSGLACVLVILRAVLVADERAAWSVIAASQVLWAVADYWATGAPAHAFPAPTDWVYFASYVAQYAGIGLLMIGRLRLLRGARWMDGLIVGFTAAAVVAAALYPSVRAATGDEVFATLIYPALDLGVIVLVAVPVGMTGWRPGRTLGWLAVGLMLMALTDVIYAVRYASGAYTDGEPLDTLWLVSFLLVAVAAWQPVETRTFDTTPRWREGVVPGACGGTSVVLLTVGGLLGWEPVTIALAAAGAGLAALRAVTIFSAHMRLLRRSHREARHDQLSGLPNRRALIEDLDGVFDGGRPVTLAFFDLDGFKIYNDTFGHAAGDALLQRLGHRVADVVGDAGRGYRLGGDEFCVLLDGIGADVEARLEETSRALRERGDGFAITASVGSVAIPSEAGEPEEALRIADQRMYARKAERRAPARMQARDLLLAVVRETEPGLDEHNDDVGRLVRQLSERLGLEGDDLDVVVRAAELHDVGKVAVPEEILHKPGPLTEDEWQLMRQHTIIGQRILAASPGLSPVGELVRASHERWDGSGYPDGLRGEEIPVGARIITVCDSFDAIVSDRPYAAGRSIAEAVAELERCAGAQFDPVVVAAFVELVRSGALGLGVQHA